MSSERLQVTQKIISEQDEILDEMSVVLGRLENQNQQVNKELVVQKGMLDDLKGEADVANDKAQSAIKKIEKQLRESSSKGGIIGALSATALVLFVLVVKS